MPCAFLVLSLALLTGFANGANDTFKGVATLFGSKTTSYRRALYLATASTFAGSLAAIFVASKLMVVFSGRGVVPDALTRDPLFAAAVILSAGLVVLVCARLGMPISTTHALTGALVGGGLAAASGPLGLHTLGKSFLLPLVVSPVLAAGLTAVGCLTVRRLARGAGLDGTACVCVVPNEAPVRELALSPAGAASALDGPTYGVLVANQSTCDAQAARVDERRVVGVPVEKVLDAAHAVSACAVSFARGLNDTPKIVGLAALAGGLGMPAIVWGVGLAMALGGLTGARRVAETMSQRITTMDRGQGLAANFITAILVIAASRWGLPVSTTHVSCGALFGIGLTGGRADWRTVRHIAAAWALTLPVSAALSGACYLLIRSF